MDENDIRTLCEFFLDGFDNDPSGVRDWLAQGGENDDEFLKAVRAFAKRA